MSRRTVYCVLGFLENGAFPFLTLFADIPIKEGKNLLFYYSEFNERDKYSDAVFRGRCYFVWSPFSCVGIFIKKNIILVCC